MGGLAMFCCSDLLTHYRIPMRCPELAVVADSFHVRPLLHFLRSNRYFYVLTLSQNSVRLYEGSRYLLSQVDLPDLPKSLDESFAKEQRETKENDDDGLVFVISYCSYLILSSFPSSMHTS
jgi:Bacterial archaeo-eukaryotic release factor family 6